MNCHILTYNGFNWQQQDENPGSVTNTESRGINSKCPICQEEFTNEQNIAKFRCGRAVCANCFGELNEHTMRRCTMCRGSSRTYPMRFVKVDDVSNDKEPAAAAAAAEEPEADGAAAAGDSDGFLPRHVVVENSINKYRDMMDEQKELSTV